MAVYECQAFDLISALFASFYSIGCVQPHIEVSVKSDKWMEWNYSEVIQRLLTKQNACDLQDNNAI